MRRLATVLLFVPLLVWSTTAAAQENGEKEAAEKTGSQSNGESAGQELSDLEDVPEEGVDPDIDLAFEKAETALQNQKPEEAAWQIRSIYLSADRYTKAQREQKRLKAKEILLKAGDRLLSSGDRVSAAQALDAAWVLGDRGVSPKYADVLARWAQEKQETNQPEALYLARRAREVDPGNQVAEQIDKNLSREPLVPYGLATAGVGALGLIGAIVFKAKLSSLEEEIASGGSRSELDEKISQYKSNRTLMGVSAAVAGVGLAGGSFLLTFKLRNFVPTSPKSLPALPEKK